MWTSEREREAMTIERDADDVARCFALERVLYEDGFEQVFAGEVIGLISAGAFVAFGMPAARARPPVAAQAAPPFEGRCSRSGVPGAARTTRREWWELNEQGTILQRRADRRDAAPRRSDRGARGARGRGPRPRGPPAAR